MTHDAGIIAFHYKSKGKSHGPQSSFVIKSEGLFEAQHLLCSCCRECTLHKRLVSIERLLGMFAGNTACLVPCDIMKIRTLIDYRPW